MEGENQFNNEQSLEYSQNYNSNEFVNESENIIIDYRSAKEKVTVALVLVVSFFAIILAITQLSNSLKKPVTDLALLASADNNANIDVNSTLLQQQKDTDNDGLSDYDELNIYETSPYLSDSDSDGISDKDEIDAGHDPNCPGSDTCFGSTINPVNQTPVDPSQQLLSAAQSDPSVLRDLLIKNGFPKAQLDKISDIDLLATYQQALAGQNPTATVGNTNQTNTNVQSIEDLKNMTGAQIRQLMIDSGAPAALLSQVSDADLKTMFLTKLDSQSN